MKSQQNTHSKKVSVLQREKKLLLAKVNQMQQIGNTSIDKQKSTEESDGCESEYEIECILKHESRKRQRRYLVQWKNSWVIEKNMNCSKLLHSYKEKHKIA